MLRWPGTRRGHIRSHAPPHLLVGRIGSIGVGDRTDKTIHTYRDRQRSFREAGPGCRSIGFGLRPRQEAYDTELISIAMGLRILVQREESGKDFTLFTDSQTAMKRVLSDAPGAGQEVAVEVLGFARRLRTYGNITIQRVPSHRGVEGNQKADQQQWRRLPSPFREGRSEDTASRS